jgi:hypothetical protein
MLAWMTRHQIVPGKCANPMNRSKPLIGSGLGSVAGKAGKGLSHEAPWCVMGVPLLGFLPVSWNMLVFPSGERDDWCLGISWQPRVFLRIIAHATVGFGHPIAGMVQKIPIDQKDNRTSVVQSGAGSFSRAQKKKKKKEGGSMSRCYGSGSC